MKDRDGNEFVWVPVKLTAENGAKSALIGEFSVKTIARCPECDGEGGVGDRDFAEDAPPDECPTCGREGTVEQSISIPWTTIKDIYAAAIAAAPQFVAGEVDDAMCERVFLAWLRRDRSKGSAAYDSRMMLEAWRSELGPALGLVEIREPSDAECIAINEHVLRAHGIEGCGAVLNGRVIFDAVSKWLKGEL